VFLGIVDFISTFPAIFFVDRFGRRIFFMAGALGMMISHVVMAGIIVHYDGNFALPGGAVSGWVGVVFIWVNPPPLLATMALLTEILSSSVPTSPTLGVLLLGSRVPKFSPQVIAVRLSAL
jgi:hypothetical protein